MSRAKRGFKRRRRVNKFKDRAEGFSLGNRTQFRQMKESVDRAGKYAYRDRAVRKREMRQLWIARLSAASNANEISYSRLIAAMKKAEVNLDRKVLSDIAIQDPTGFTAIVNHVRSQAPAH